MLFLISSIFGVLYIEDYPFIIRFKTDVTVEGDETPAINVDIEDYPFIIRFKTLPMNKASLLSYDIEDYPFIIRFKTSSIFPSINNRTPEYWRLSIYNKV